MLDIQLRRHVLRLNKLANSQVVIRLVISWIQSERLLVIHGCFLRNTEAKVCVGEVFIEIVLASVLEALLEHHYRLRVPAQHVESSCSVVVQVQRDLELFGLVLNL